MHEDEGGKIKLFLVLSKLCAVNFYSFCSQKNLIRQGEINEINSSPDSDENWTHDLGQVSHPL
jgi:hypothetical protein